MGLKSSKNKNNYNKISVNKKLPINENKLPTYENISSINGNKYEYNEMECIKNKICIICKKNKGKSVKIYDKVKTNNKYCYFHLKDNDEDFKNSETKRINEIRKEKLKLRKENKFKLNESIKYINLSYNEYLLICDNNKFKDEKEWIIYKIKAREHDDKIKKRERNNILEKIEENHKEIKRNARSNSRPKFSLMYGIGTSESYMLM
jgi:hypothetical protein